jgi:hypothetical protein
MMVDLPKSAPSAVVHCQWQSHAPGRNLQYRVLLFIRLPRVLYMEVLVRVGAPGDLGTN